MRKSIYTRISKSLGWEAAIGDPIPTIEKAKELKKQVEDKSQVAFKKVFEIHRFSANPVNNDECEAMEIIGSAFRIGSRTFKDMYDDED